MKHQEHPPKMGCGIFYQATPEKIRQRDERILLENELERATDKRDKIKVVLDTTYIIESVESTLENLQETDFFSAFEEAKNATKSLKEAIYWLTEAKNKLKSTF